ncbi:MAG TPA: hypothetical protein VKP88_01540 [Candidatus Paceibacterota bacterium]|nr:hypothetical protein [Candidatus Paceibacterota bacterium]
MTFTPAQLGLLATYFFERPDLQANYTKIAQAVYDFVALGDPYDFKLVLEFVKGANVAGDVKGEDLEYMVQKAIFHGEKAIAAK